MKKIILSVALATAVLSSCSLNEEPTGQLTFTDAFESVNDFARFRNGLYGDLRAIGTGAYLSNTEIQMDMFNGVITNGNRVGTLANGNILPSDSDIESLWGGLYGSINTSNLMIEKSEAFIANNPDLTEGELLELNRYLGEAKFSRAFMYFQLYQYFCYPYSEANADVAAMGVPLVTVYKPSADRGTYPGRSTLRATFELIEGDLAEAYKDIKDYEDNVSAESVAQNAVYLNSLTVKALQARVALYKSDYNNALKLAQDVINDGPWTLTSSANYKAMWSTDAGSELIFVPFADADESAYINATGTAWTGVAGNDADYIPSSDLVELYDDNDIRKTSFIETRGLAVNGETVQSPVFVKFPGNAALNNGLSLAGKNKPKMFRLSEMYLIVAEAAYLCDSPDETASLKALNDIRRARSTNPRFYKDVVYSGNELLQQVRRERQKELVGEGFRMFDLRRYGQGFTRSALYTNEEVGQILVYAGLQVRYDVNDYRYVWPIPSAEMDVNPQLAGQQNKGY